METRTSLTSPDVEQINFSWLLTLRWGAIAGQLLTIVVVDRIMGIPLPLFPLFGIVGIEFGTNLLYAARIRTARTIRPWELPAVMALDVLLLTGLLYFSGGPFNPFSFLYLVQIALAAVVLNPRWTWTLVGLSLACSAVLFLYYRPLSLAHTEHMGIHLRGMWVAFGVAASFIVYFLMRVTRALEDREAELEVARRETARHERLASLATLAAGAAHELATPLSTIALAAEELENAIGANAPAPIDDVRLIRDQVDRCRSVLSQMAADAGQTRGEAIVPMALPEMIEAAISGLKNKHAVRVQISERAHSERLVLPRRALEQALRGVVRNAQEASPPDGEVVVRAEVDEQELRIEVSDQGHGMPADVLARAGEPFFTTKQPGRGMGLGLFLVRTLLERLGGKFTLDSQPGRGTSATLYLPVSAAATTHRIANTR